MWTELLRSANGWDDKNKKQKTMNSDPVYVDINMRQNVDEESGKAVQGIDKLSRASSEAQRRVAETLSIQQEAIKRLREELVPMRRQIADMIASSSTPDAPKFEALTKGIDELEGRLIKAGNALAKMEIDAGSFAVRAKNLEDRIRGLVDEIEKLNRSGEAETSVMMEKQAALQSYINAHDELLKSINSLSGEGEFAGLVEEIKTFSEQLSDAGKGAETFADRGDSLGKAMQHVSSMLALARGQLGSNNQMLNESIRIVDTLSRTKGILAAVTKKLSVAMGVSAVAAKALTAALSLGLSLAVGAAISLVEKYISKQRAARQEQEKIADAIAQSGASQIASYEKLRASYVQLGNDIKAKEKFIRDNQDAFKQLGVAINGVNDADNVFISNTEAFRQAIEHRAMAAAALEMATENYKKMLIERKKRKEKEGLEKLKNEQKIAYARTAAELRDPSTPVAQDNTVVLPVQLTPDLVKISFAATKKEVEEHLTKKEQEYKDAAEDWIRQNAEFGNMVDSIFKEYGFKGITNTKKDTKEENARRAAEKKLSDLSYDIQKEIDATTVAAMQEGRDQKLDELKANYDARMALIEKHRKEIAELEKTTGVDGSKQKTMLNTLEEVEKKKYDAKKRAVNEGAAAAITEVQEEINARFRKANEQRLAEIDKFYKEQAKKARENGATQAQLDEIELRHKRDTELEKHQIALEGLDFDTQIDMRRARIQDRQVMLQTDREEKILKIQLNAAQKRLSKLKELEAAGGDAGKDIKAVIAEIEAMNAELDRIPTQKMAELAGYAQQTLDGLGGFASSFDDSLGRLFDMASGAVGGIASLGTGIASGNPQQIIQGAMQLLDVAGKVLKANKQANEEIRKFNLSLAQQAIDYSLAVIRSIKDIKSETDNIFTSNYTNTLTQGMAGYNAAIEKQSELMRKLGAATVKTGVEKKKFLGITYGTRDVYSNLLKQYPDLIKKDGTLNREMAETLKKSGNLSEETTNLIDNILNASDAAKEAVQAVESELQNLVGSLGQELKSALDDAFASGTDSAKAMTDSVVKKLKELSTQKLFNAVFGGIFSQLEQRIKDSVGTKGDRDLTDDIDWFMEQYGRYVDDYNKGLSQLRESISKKYGTDPFADADSGRKAVNKGIAQASQDSIDELNGRLTFLVMKVSDISVANAAHADLGREQLFVLRAMLGSLETIAENSEFLRKLQRIDDNIDRLTREGTYIKK